MTAFLHCALSFLGDLEGTQREVQTKVLYGFFESLQKTSEGEELSSIKSTRRNVVAICNKFAGDSTQERLKAKG